MMSMSLSNAVSRHLRCRHLRLCQHDTTFKMIMSANYRLHSNKHALNALTGQKQIFPSIWNFDFIIQNLNIEYFHFSCLIWLFQES